MLEKTLTNDGCTVIQPVSNPCIPMSGYVVGVAGFAVQFIVAEDTNMWDNAVWSLLQAMKHLDVLDQPYFGVGTWICGECADRHIHFDVVFLAATEMEAMGIAREHKQITIYDVANDKVIAVGEEEDEDREVSL
jgi:hypothetical protein